jgi:hypothetical protein
MRATRLIVLIAIGQLFTSNVSTWADDDSLLLPENRERLTACLIPEAIDWEFTPAGDLVPVFDSADLRQLLAMHEEAVPALFDAMDVPETRNVARVALGWLQGRRRGNYRILDETVRGSFGSVTFEIDLPDADDPTKTITYDEHEISRSFERDHMVANAVIDVKRQRLQERIALPAESPDPDRTAVLRSLSDRDIEWHPHDFTTVYPVIRGEFITEYSPQSLADVEACISLLQDDESFVAGHLVLSHAFGPNCNGSYLAAGYSWYFHYTYLKIEVVVSEDDEGVRSMTQQPVDADQRAFLRGYWNRRLALGELNHLDE